MREPQIRDSKIINFLYPKLIKNKVHIGCNKYDNHPCMIPFLKKSEGTYSEFNLNYTYNQILVARNKVQQLIISKEEILFISYQEKYRELLSKVANKFSIPILVDGYPDNLFENILIHRKEKIISKFLTALKKSKYWSNMTDFEKTKINEINQSMLNVPQNIHHIPKAIFILDSSISHNAIKDAQKYGVLIFSIVNSNNSPLGIDYFIPANNRDVESVRAILDQIFTDLLYSEMIKQRGIEKKFNKLPEKEAHFSFNVDKTTILRKIIEKWILKNNF